ncbi:UNVERIFIED_CONTAM: hypothetical protein Slati_2971800 [Sesamum latifolium]|uniref:Reverse transcriptase Ty1/copia-type domain-containing protein n=1 Tax=Sesamum latifolium TaxID=2727402 RepID=A0AAW2VG71_9LAMI
MLVVSPSLQLVTSVKQYLDTLFTIKDLGVARYFLGLQISRSNEGLSLTEMKYIHDILSDPGMLSAKSATTPLPQGVKLFAEAGSLLPDPEPYRRLVGRLLYLGFTRPGYPHISLFFSVSSSLQLRAYCDVDWVSCTVTKCSISGFCVFLGLALILWKTKKQATVSRSSAEAEYRSLAAMVCELQWLSYILPALGVSPSLPIPMFYDNKVVFHIMANPVFHERTKHLDIDCHVVRNQYHSGFVLPSFICSKEQLVDLFTKNLSGPLFASLLSKMDLFSLHLGPYCGGDCWNSYPASRA